MENMKICKKCGKELPIIEFYENKGSKNGRVNVCKSCRKVQMRLAYVKRKEKRKEFGEGNLNPDLALFTSKQLMDELAARGYHASGKVIRDFSF